MSRWSIRRKLLVCLAIVLAIVAALAYSGFSGGYSYKKLAWTIRVRATDLKAGNATATVWANDLTHDYVHENSAYST